ncbi:DUF4157 domain-containing protein [Nostoc sp. FACHB-110]|uniref:eCIS core domain-containing protein n=1 Tax=Nostoc sp. FACHB-110 TaxID=2692834 RepID=UPI001685E915|nr:DUF4157 domain-containing protein [Nostoc sp. FACHB-110]MBD2438748.1 DUF4157 domain-containing protein [Nostoc sp. FACHB-110]
MYRKQISPKASPSVRSMAKSQEIAPSRSYGSLSSVVQRVQHDPNSVSEDERQQLESAIGSRSTKEILAGKQTPWVPEFQGISAQLWGNVGQVGAPIQAKGKDDIGVSQVQQKNQTGLPDILKVGIENLSGMAMDDVRVHYNSSKPSQLQALAYTQGTDIHVAPGQEKHLPHEAWHVVQQMQGRVKPTMLAKGVGINDDQGLEREADVMGAKAAVKAAQLEDDTEEGALLDSKLETLQQKGIEDEKELLQRKFTTVQRFGHEKEELCQDQFEPIDRRSVEEDEGKLHKNSVAPLTQEPATRHAKGCGCFSCSTQTGLRAQFPLVQAKADGDEGGRGVIQLKCHYCKSEEHNTDECPWKTGNPNIKGDKNAATGRRKSKPTSHHQNPRARWKANQDKK